METQEQANAALALTDKGEEVETTNAPEAQIALNPEALMVQYQTQAKAVLERALEFVRRQGSSTSVIVDVISYKALKEEVAGFAMVSYELQLQTVLTRLQPSSEDPSPGSAAPEEGTAPVEDPQPVAQD